MVWYSRVDFGDLHPRRASGDRHLLRQACMKVCPDCKAVTHEPGDPDESGCPGYPVFLPGELHKKTCVKVAPFLLSPEQERELQERLIEMERVRRRGAAKALNFWIG